MANNEFMIKSITRNILLNDGRIIRLETGKLAKQADGSVVLKMNNTVILATVCAAKDIIPSSDFLPLQVEYREKYSAFGRFPGGFMKREGRASDYEILTCRIVDRVLRPLFPSDYHTEIFVNIILYSSDGKDMPDALAGLAASAALTISNIPFNGPISEVRVGRINGKFILNPTFEQLKKSDLDIIVGATIDSIIMVEGDMEEISESEVLEAIKFAHESIKDHCRIQLELMKAVGSDVKREYCREQKDEILQKDIITKLYNKVYEIIKSSKIKKERNNALKKVKEKYFTQFALEDLTYEKKELITRYFNDIEKQVVRNCILHEGIRLDGRMMDEIRPIWAEVGPISGPHGSAIFSRGETQALATVTLGAKSDEKLIDDVLNNEKERFLLHYNFPPFSTGEAKPKRGVGRREIGHGHLAYRALKSIIPKNYPYVIRIVSDILESNGSSSMATVCASTIALMDAGVKIKQPVSGIAIGLVLEKEKYIILSDISGEEDHLGDMDFKITGTLQGITAIQMDIKVTGLSYEILMNALTQAKEGRIYILNKIAKIIPEPRKNFKPHTPYIEVINIRKESIGTLIGPGGKVIQKIQEETESIITIEENEGVGKVEIFGSGQCKVDAAKDRIKKIIAIPEIGTIYEGKIRSIVPYGAFVEFLPGKDGLLHISEIDWKRLENIEELGLKEGDIIKVKLISIDLKTGKFKLSRKVLLPH